MSKTDPMWVFENYGEAAELIDEHEAVIAQQATRIAELEAENERFVEALEVAAGKAVTERENLREELAALKSQPSAVHLLFDGPPGPECGRFVEAEDASGRSINAGEWSQRPDGYWQLVIQRPCTGDLLAKIAELEQSVEVATTECVQQYRWRLEDSECGRDEINDGVDMLLARLKAQPSGVVDSDEVMQMAFEIGEPADDGSGYWFDLESFDEFIAAYTGRLNPCRAQAVPDGWVRVPVDPTPAMVSAYLAAQKAKAMASDMAWGVSDPAENFKAGFSAMIAAAIPAKKESD